MRLWRHRGFLSFLLGIIPLLCASAKGESLRYHLDAALDEGNRCLSAHQLVEISNWSQRSLDELYFHLFPNSSRAAEITELGRWSQGLDAFEDPLRAFPRGDDGGYIEIGSVLVDGQMAEYVVQGTWMVISLPEIIPPGGQAKVEMEFWVKIPRLNAHFGYWKGIYTMATWHPQMAFLTEDGWLYQERVALEESLANFADYRVRLRLPAGMVVAATGFLEGARRERRDLSVQTWSAVHVRRFGWVGSRDFLISTTWAHGVAVSSYYLPRHRKEGPLAGMYAGRALLFLGARLGWYPRRRYAVVETHLPLAGLSLPGLCLLSGLLYDLDVLGDLFEATIAHEAAHQWWGERVDAREPWFCEGFAKFWEFAYMRAHHGTSGWLIKRKLLGGALPRISLSWLSRGLYLNLARFGMEDKMTLMAGQFRESLSHQGAVYAKAPLVLQMLANLLGNDGFLLLCRRLLGLPEHTVVTTSHVMDVTREVAGRDMDWFFQQWFATTFRCDYAIADFRCRRVSQGYVTRLRMDRRGKIIMPVTVTVSLHDGTRVRKRWDGRARKWELLLSSTRPVQSARLASDQEILDTQPANNFCPYKRRIIVSLWPLSNVNPEVFQGQIYPSVRFGSSGEKQVGIGLITRGMMMMSTPFIFQPEHELGSEFRYRCQKKRWCGQIGASMRARFLGKRAMMGVRYFAEAQSRGLQGTVRWIWSPFLCRTPYRILKLRGRYGHQPGGESRFSLCVEYISNRRRTVFFPTFGDLYWITWEGGFYLPRGTSCYHRFSIEVWRHHLLFRSFRYSLRLFGGLLLNGFADHEAKFDLRRDAHLYGFREGRYAGGNCLSVGQELSRPVWSYLAVALVGRCGLLGSQGSRVKIVPELGLGLRFLGNSPLAVRIDLLAVCENLRDEVASWRPAWNIRVGTYPGGF